MHLQFYMKSLTFKAAIKHIFKHVQIFWSIYIILKYLKLFTPQTKKAFNFTYLSNTKNFTHYVHENYANLIFHIIFPSKVKA